MRPRRASQTAEWVAWWRGLVDQRTSVPGYSDPVARHMLGPWAGLWLRAGQLAFAAYPVDPDARLAVLSVITLRVAALDAEIRRAIAAGARQAVLLGAGFDTRAYRMPELSELRVFEVDHPSTQAVKQARARGLTPTTEDLRYVPVDFTHDDLGERLASAGHDAGAPTVWIWEGVVMYLPDEALRATLASVRARSAPGSALLLHYHEPDPPGWVTDARHLLFRALGEPHIGLRDPPTVHEELRRAGFAVADDMDAAEQAARLGAPLAVGPRERISRIAVATV